MWSENLMGGSLCNNSLYGLFRVVATELCFAAARPDTCTNIHAEISVLHRTHGPPQRTKQYWGHDRVYRSTTTRREIGRAHV